MEKKIKSVAPRGEWVKNKIIKLITFFTCIVLLFVSICMFILKPYGLGYKYYENNTIQIGVTQQENLLDQTINDYIDELWENGYYIYSVEMKKDISYKHTVIRKNDINTEELKTFIKDITKVFVFSTKLLIDDEIYYFKSENECNDFVNELKKYNENITTESSGEIVEVTKITNEQALQEKIEAYRIDKEKRDEEARLAAEREKQRQIQVSSRSGGYSRIENPGSSRHPLDSYTCISSEFGPRWGSFHSGVDFATPVGTEVHAWKAGKVICASWVGTYGNYIKIQHNDGTISCYAHLSQYTCSVGDYVNCHELIAYSGNTGNSTGPHLHFEIKINDQFVNPLNYL